MSISGPLKWHGGKFYLAKRIVALFPRHLHYCEPYAGGLSVLLARDPTDKNLWLGETGNNGGVSEVVNDLDRDLTNFWTCLQYPPLFEEMQRRLQCVPLSRWEWEDARAFLAAEPLGNAKSSIDHAIAFFILCRQSLAGRKKGFTSLTRNRTRRGVNGNVSEWIGAVEGMRAVHERLRSVVIENMDAVSLIRREDESGTLFYCDPPYLHETRASTSEYGEYEMTTQQHRELLETLADLKGKFLLSGYANPLYDSFQASCNWKCHTFDLPNNSAGGDSKRRMTESLWCNY